jgi:hypothetical protein
MRWKRSNRKKLIRQERRRIAKAVGFSRQKWETWMEGKRLVLARGMDDEWSFPLAPSSQPLSVSFGIPTSKVSELDWMFYSSKFICWNLILKVMAFGGRALGVIRVKLSLRVVPLWKRPQRDLSLPPSCEDTAKSSYRWLAVSGSTKEPPNLQEPWSWTS